MCKKERHNSLSFSKAQKTGGRVSDPGVELSENSLRGFVWIEGDDRNELSFCNYTMDLAFSEMDNWSAVNSSDKSWVDVRAPRLKPK